MPFGIGDALFPLLSILAVARSESVTERTDAAVFEATIAAPAAGPVSPERALAAKLGRSETFLIGAGNDAANASDANLTHAYELTTPVDIHYMYLTGLEWTSWKPNGGYVTEHANAAKARGIVPMFTLYQAATHGDGNLGSMNSTSFMTSYWAGVRTMFERLGAFGSPAMVHLEPDLWGYAQRVSGDDPAAVPMQVAPLVPECADLPNDVSGASRCMIRLARVLAPNVAVGLSASEFGAYVDGVSDPNRIGAYLNKLGAGDTDFMVLETLDRDAGCFERGIDPACQREGTFYWDETNTRHPNFHDHLAWASALHVTTGKPLLWWQMPLGRASGSPGGAPSAYRDNRVQYLFSHAAEFAAAGGIGAVFGPGAPNQTTLKTDGGQFATALAGYRAAPAPLL